MGAHANTQLVAVGEVVVQRKLADGKGAVVVAGIEGFQPGIILAVAYGESTERATQGTNRKTTVTTIAVADVKGAVDGGADSVIGSSVEVHGILLFDNTENPHTGRFPVDGLDGVPGDTK